MDLCGVGTFSHLAHSVALSSLAIIDWLSCLTYGSWSVGLREWFRQVQLAMQFGRFNQFEFLSFVYSTWLVINNSVVHCNHYPITLD